MENFSTTLTHKFYPSQNGEPVALPSQSPAIYIFDEKPTLTVAAAGTGAVESITTWSEQAKYPYARTWTVTAIDDPDPTSSTESRQYWEAINFVTKASGETTCVLREFWLERLGGFASFADVSVDDIKRVYPAIASYLDDQQIQDKLLSAIVELRVELESRGYKWERIQSLESVKLPLAYKVIELSCLGEFKGPDDKFLKRAEVYAGRYAELMKIIKLPVDTVDDGVNEADSDVEMGRGYAIIDR